MNLPPDTASDDYLYIEDEPTATDYADYDDDRER